jgi:hypothetical protein
MIDIELPIHELNLFKYIGNNNNVNSSCVDNNFNDNDILPLNVANNLANPLHINKYVNINNTINKSNNKNKNNINIISLLYEDSWKDLALQELLLYNPNNTDNINIANNSSSNENSQHT